MSEFLDTTTWPRREAFEFFRGFDKPYFNVCVRLDAAPLKAALAERGGGSFALACYYLALRLANLHQAFRLRLQGGRVRVHEVVHGGCTVLREDESFSFAYLDYDADFARFSQQAVLSMQAARQSGTLFDPRPNQDAVIHITTVPWLHFSSFSHARNWGREDSVPKLAFGRTDADGARLWLPFSVEVHHALMDGLHVGRYVQALEAALLQPSAWLAEGAP